MTVLVVSREQHLDHIVDVLVRELDGVPPEQIAAEADRAYTELVNSSRVEAFIPILALRRARAALQADRRVAS
jgi:hypothetical protein